MRKFVAPLLIALAVAAPVAAFAATTAAPKPAALSSQAEQSSAGTVKAIDLKAHTLTLADGKIYQLPSTFRDPGLKAGEKVTVHWKMNGSAYQATNVTIG